MRAQQPNESPPQVSPAKIVVKAETVLVPVVVRDSHGGPVGNLTKEDFKVFDRDKQQEITGFRIESRAALRDAPKDAELGPVVPGAAPHSLSAPVPNRFIVFLFDDLHLEAGNLLQVQKAATKMLAEPLADTDLAAVVSLSGMNSGLTRDRAALQEAVTKKKMQPLYRHDDHACPNIDYYQADLIVNKRNEQALELAENDYISCAHLQGQPPNMVETVVRSDAAHSLATGEQDVWATLASLREFVRKMGTLPGQRTLILLSPGFLTLTPEAMAEKSQILDLAAQTNVTISAMDARGLYTTEMDASQRGGSSMLDMMTGEHSQFHRDTMNLDEDVMAELADGSGGTYFHNSNDLEGGLKSLARGPEYIYVLEFSLGNVKRDGSYHRLQVQLDQSGLKLQARRGYFAPKPDKETARSTAATPPAVPQTAAAATSPAPGISSAPPSAQPPSVTAAPPVSAPPAPPASSANAATPPAASAPATRKHKDAEKSPNGKELFWYPPDVDAPVRSLSSSPPCPLSAVLEHAGVRADDLVSNLQNFTAQEKIDYRMIGSMAHLLDQGEGAFDYTVAFEQRPQGLAVEEARTPERGSRAIPASGQDIGLPELALIFLSNFQADYEMKCEGAAQWNGQPTWIVHFQQRKDRQSHTASFSAKGVAYPAKLKGRAWIAEDSSDDSGEVVHLETSLMEPVPAANVRFLYLSIDYAPVQFRTQNVKVWLPQAVNVYGDFGDHRTIVSHTFTNFLLFSVQTDQVIQKPANP
jgi:VWFA-related protein